MCFYQTNLYTIYSNTTSSNFGGSRFDTSEICSVKFLYWKFDSDVRSVLQIRTEEQTHAAFNKLKTDFWEVAPFIAFILGIG